VSRTGQRTRVKVCCIASIEEAWLAIDAGADAIGLVSKMPSGPGTIPDESIAEIAARIPPGVETVLLTSRTDTDRIAEHHALCRTTTIQLVDHVEPDDHAALRQLLPGVRLMQVIHVIDADSVAQAQAAGEHCHAVLLDSGNPNAAVKELGGTGRVHDWDLSQRIVESCGVPVFLAGGLNPINAAQAVSRVGPFGLDVCTGLRTNNRLAPQKLTAIFAAIGR